MSQIAEPYVPLRAIRHLEKGRVVIFAAGLGVPYFSTDTCAAQRALEIHAEPHPEGDEGRRRVRPPIRSSTPIRAALRDCSSTARSSVRGYGVMDATAISLCMENALPIVVFDLREEGNIRRVVIG